MKNLRENYSKLKEKYNLPSFESLDKEFEILYMKDVFEISFPLRFIRRRINDKISWICNMIQSLMQPNPGSMINMEESTFFTKEKKDEMRDLLKKLMFLERSSLNLDMEISEEKDAEYIKTTFKDWEKIKPKILEITDILNKGWKKETSKKGKNHNYFG